MSQITTHILDTSLGKPAKDVAIILEQSDNKGGWIQLGNGKTNSDGRLPNLLPVELKLEDGIYRLTFETGLYYKNLNIKGFYPYIKITFEIFDGSHYHVPLLLNPYGYSTYRGS